VSRARTPAAREARRSEILRAAAALFDEAPYPEVTIARVAERAGLAKGSVYLYFRSKEELFLELVRDRLTEWLGAIDGDLQNLGRNASPEEVGRTMAAQIAVGSGGNGEIVRLLVLLHGTLEPNVSAEKIADFRRGLLAAMTAAGESFEKRLAGLRAGEGFRFLFRFFAAVVGLAQSALPPPRVAAALASAPDLAVFRLDFERELAEVTAALLARAAPRSIPPAVRRKTMR
jgi:AcrR family transcriptional regulator